MKKVILGGIDKHLEDSTAIGHSQQSFMKVLISFYDRVPHLADLGKQDDVTFLDFGKTFDTTSQCPSGQISGTQLDNHAYMIGEQLAQGSAQRVTGNGVTLGWGPVTSGVHRAPFSALCSLTSSLTISTGLKGYQVILLTRLNWEELWTPSRAGNPCRETNTLKLREGQSPTMQNLTRACAEFCSWDETTHVVCTDLGTGG